MFGLLPNPLHPAIVHMPIALIVLLPFFVAGSIIAIRKGARPLVAWGITTALLATLSLSAFAALQTGKSQGEKVEEAIGEQVVETHEEVAETFLILSCVVLGVAGFGFLKGTPGRAGPWRDGGRRGGAARRGRSRRAHGRAARLQAQCGGGAGDGGFGGAGEGARGGRGEGREVTGLGARDTARGTARGTARPTARRAPSTSTNTNTSTIPCPLTACGAGDCTLPSPPPGG